MGQKLPIALVVLVVAATSLLRAADPANPVASTTESIAAGKKVYDGQCASCHGPAGRGDGKSAGQLNPKPADLTDAAWSREASDGTIFTAIRDGSKGTGMKSFGSRLTSNEMWNVVNYVRTLQTK